MKRIMPYEPQHPLTQDAQKVAHVSDYFVCQNCDHAAYMKIIGNTAKCPNCGGTMKRSGT